MSEEEIFNKIDKMLDEHLIDEFKKYFLNNN